MLATAAAATTAAATTATAHTASTLAGSGTTALACRRCAARAATIGLLTRLSGIAGAAQRTVAGAARTVACTHRVTAAAGPFSITGNLHLVPGTEGNEHAAVQGRRFLPLTDAYILHNGEPPFEHVVSVVIVNTAHITSLVPLVTLA